MNELRKAIFLDRDGVINKWEHPGDGAPSEQWYILDWDQFEFLPGVLDVLVKFYRDFPQYDIIVVSNQSGIGKGLVEENKIHEIFNKMCHEVRQSGGNIRSYAFCPHAPDAGCYCRKPRPGMLWWAAYNYGLDLEQCWMIGDQASDMGAADGAYIPTKQRIFVSTPYNDPVGYAIAQWNVESLGEAIYHIIETDK